MHGNNSGVIHVQQISSNCQSAQIQHICDGGGWQLRAPQGGSRPSAQSAQCVNHITQRTENIANYMMMKFSVFCAPVNVCPVQLS